MASHLERELSNLKQELVGLGTMVENSVRKVILAKEKIIGLIRKTNPIEINSNLIGFIFVGKKTNKIKILFDKNSLEFKGWETKDAYSNNVSFIISNLKTNNQIIDDFFKIPKEEDL